MDTLWIFQSYKFGFVGMNMKRNWKYKKIGDVCLVERGGSPRPIESFITDDSNGINWIKIGDADESMYITKTAQKIKPEGMKKSRYVQPGDFLLSNSMSFGRPYILKIDGCIHDGWLVLRDENHLFDKRFLYYYLSSKSTYNKFRMMAVGGVVNNLNSEMVRKVDVPIPDIEEQQQIADLLDKINAIIDSRKLQMVYLDDLIKARFVEMFGDGYPEDALVNLCNIIDYRGKTPEKVESGLPFITAKNVKMHQMNMEPREYISKETYDKVMVRGFPKEGDVVFTTEAPLGNVCRIPHFDTEFYIGQRIVTLQTEKLIPAYLEYALSTEEFKQKYMGKSSGSTVTGIRVRLLEQLTIPVPPIDLQKQFADFVTQINKSKVVVQKALDEAQLLFDSLMQKYFG